MSRDVQCGECKGRGYIETLVPDGTGDVQCAACNGSGIWNGIVVRSALDDELRRRDQAADEVERVRDRITDLVERNDWGVLTLYDLLGQDRWWRNRDRAMVEIADMDPGWAANAYRFMMRRAPVIEFRYSIIEVGKFGAGGDHGMIWILEAEADRRAQNPAAWLAGTPLMQALARRGGL